MPDARPDAVEASLMGIISWIVLGAIAGFIASYLLKAREGLVLMIILGIVGAAVGGWLTQAVLHSGDVNGVNIESIVIAVVGAVVVIVAYRLVTRQPIRP
jgi:uncharacterized membrane protein YeaQ/YmgE (transglycosylase-associated protein family)